MAQVIDLSQPILGKQTCSFALGDTAPKISFEEGDSHGVTFITSRLDNLHSNTCTHIDFPGHLASLGRKFPKPVGMYPIERFIGTAFVLDVSSRLVALRAFFDKVGKLSIDLRDEQRVLNFLQALDTVMIDQKDIEVALETAKCPISRLTGLLVYTGLSEWWRPEKFESWEYIYFYGPYFSEKACELLIDNKLSFVGIDAFQLDHPIINFNGHELPLILHKKAKDYVQDKLRTFDAFSNHHALLAKDILIYESLRIPAELSYKEIHFSGVPLNMRMDGMNDNALARPYASMV